MPATPYRRVIFGLTTAEGWNGRFEPIFFQNVFSIHMTKPPKKFDRVLGGFSPPKQGLLPSPERFAKNVDEPTALRYKIPLNSL